MEDRSGIKEELMQELSALEQGSADIEQREATKRIAAERLRAVNECLLSLGKDVHDNIRRLTALVGRLTGATAAIYNRLEADMLVAAGQWQTPADFKTRDRAQGHICYDLMRKNEDRIVHIRNLAASPYADTDPNVRAYGLATYVGHLVRCGLEPVGSLCIVFQQDFTPGAEDELILGIIAAAIGAEERRQRNETAMKDSEEQSRLYFEHSADVIYTIGLDYRIRSVSPSVEYQLGYRPEEFIGQPVTELGAVLAPECLEQALKEISSLFSGNTITASEYVFIARDGARKIAEVSGAPLKKNGAVIGSISVARDITERKKAEEAIKLNEARLESLLRISEHPAESVNDLLDFALNEAIVLTGSRIGYLYFYDEIKKEFTLNTWSREVMPQCAVAEPQNVYQLEKTGIWGEAVRQARPIMVNDFAAPSALRKGLPAGHAPLHRFLTIPVFSQDHIVAVVGVANKQEDYNDADVRQLNLMMDAVWKIVQRKTAEEEREKLREQLDRVQKLESIGTLAGGIAHDFNNLLMGIQGHASLTLLDLDPSHPHHARLKHIEELVRSGADLTGQLLGFARGGRYAAKPADMNDIIEKTAAMFGRTRKEITIYRQFRKDLWSVEADQPQMEQVFMNLYVNAWHAMPGGGEISLATDNVFLNDQRTYYVAPGKYVKITVSDTGTGMDAQTRERIFDPFFTTKGMGRGTGLGLATVYGIIKGHGGLIDVTSVPGHGTTFDIYLPATEKAVIEEATAEQKVPRGTETILLVDDETIVMAVAREMLEFLGYRVHCAGSGQEAMAVFHEKKDEIDLVVLDMVMPGISGGETFDLLRRIDPKISVLLSSGYSIDGKAREILERGCDGFLQKPYQLAQLARDVRNCLDKERS